MTDRTTSEGLSRGIELTAEHIQQAWDLLESYRPEVERRAQEFWNSRVVESYRRIIQRWVDTETEDIRTAMPFYGFYVDPAEYASAFNGTGAASVGFEGFPDCPIQTNSQDHRMMNPLIKGRYWRAFARVVRAGKSEGRWMYSLPTSPGETWANLAASQVFAKKRPLTYRELDSAVRRGGSELRRKYRDNLAVIPYMTNRRGEPEHIVEIPDYPTQGKRDPDLNPILHDVALMIRRDLHDACFALNDPDLWYPGVEDGIEPVPDDHVRLVIWATQRELNRELRSPERGTANYSLGGTLPAVPLAELPWRIQRAFAERRRLRFAEWGLGRQQWEQGTFSLFSIPDDEWVPPWAEVAK